MKLQISAGRLIVTPENYGDTLQVRKLAEYSDFFEMDIGGDEGDGFLVYGARPDEADVIEFVLKQKGK